MSDHLAWVYAFTFLIHLINTLSYSVRIVGVRTGRIAASIALFNIFLLVARMAHAFQAPLLAKRAEGRLLADQAYDVVWEFRTLLVAATIGSVVGALLSPTFRKLFASYVNQFDSMRSVPRLLLHCASKIGGSVVRESLKPPSLANIQYFRSLRDIPVKLALMNLLAISVLTAGVFASLLAGYESPEVRATAVSLAPVVTGLATIILMVFIDPKLSALTDDMLDGKASPSYFYTCVITMVVTHIGGTILAQVVLAPSTDAIRFFASAL